MLGPNCFVTLCSQLKGENSYSEISLYWQISFPFNAIVCLVQVGSSPHV